MVINTILYTVLCFDLIIMLISFVAWMDHRAYRRWEQQFNKEGIKWPLQGFQDVAYREIPSRKTNR